MTFIKKRSNAILITVAVVVIATFVSVHANLSRISSDIERMFYEGVYLEAQGYLQPSVNSQIEKQIDAALGLATIMRNYPELSATVDKLLSARVETLDAKIITYKGIVSINMQAAFYELLHAARNVGLSERDLEAATKYYESFSGAQLFVAREVGPSYNDMVAHYHVGFGFPTDIINKIVLANPPDRFEYSFPDSTYPYPDFVFP